MRLFCLIDWFTITTMSEQDLVIRNIVSRAEFRAVERLQSETWGANDVTPLTNLVASVEVGAILIGAFDNNELVGFAYGFPGIYKGEFEIHSHMLAVNPAYRNHDLGYKLKLVQREEALRKGFKRMTWTFDPLQSPNAHLNLRKLGVIADEYKINYYGDGSQNLLHRDIGTDRLWVTWLLDNPRVTERLNATLAMPPALPQDALPLIGYESTNLPSYIALDETSKAKRLLIDVPKSIINLQQNNLSLARVWRDETRKAFTQSFSSGFYVTDFIRRNDDSEIGGAFVLTRKETTIE
jgi:predicted GNAT superfamily acetyltransferase